MPPGWQVVSIAVVVAMVVVGAEKFDRTRDVVLPAIGVFDWSDVWFLAFVVLSFPVLQYFAPVRVAEAVTILLIVASVADLMRAAAPSRPVLRRVVTTCVAVIASTVSLHHFAVVPRAVIGDLLLIPFVWIAALAWAQTGMRVSHLIAIVIGLTVFDLAATPLSHVMGPLLRRLGEQQPQLIFTVPSAHGVALLGIGDVLIAVVVPLVVRRSYGHLAGRVAAGLCVMAYIAGLSVAALRPGVTIPLMVTLGPATLLAIGFAELRASRLNSGSMQP